MNNLLKIITYIFFPLVSLLFATQIYAADSDDVTATVTPKVISVILSPTSVDFGVLGVNTFQDTTATGSAINSSITATNNGTVAESFGIQGSDSADWTLVAEASHGVTEQFSMGFCNNGNCDGSPVWTDVGDGTYTSLATNIAILGTQEFDLRIHTPVSTTATDEQSISITVLATEY